MAEVEFDDELGDELTSNLEERPSHGQGETERSRLTWILVAVAVVVFGIGSYMFFQMTSEPQTGDLLGSGQSKGNGAAANEAPRSGAPQRKKNVKYETIFTQLPGDQSAKITKELSVAGIPFSTAQVGKNFDILVDRDRMDDARHMLALKSLPGGSAKGYELLDASQSLGVTEFDKRVRFLRALSGELEKAVLQFEMIETVKVQIVLPEQKLFTVNQPPVTASVLIRRHPGSLVTEDTVYAIIQLVANAVENLQPENVSVIDTSGMVLSDGVFEKRAARFAVRLRPGVPLPPASPQTVQQAVATSSTKVGKPFIPDLRQIEQWYKIKQQYEDMLTRRVYRQLAGILPMGAYKVVVSATLDSIEDGHIKSVKRLSTSIVVDNNHPDIVLEPQFKQQVFDTVASAIGYVKGRDVIKLTKANFNLMSPAEREEIRQMNAEDKPLKKQIEKYLPYAGAAVAGLVGLGVLASLVRWIFRRRESSLSIDSEIRGTDFSDLQDEIQAERSIDQIREIAGRWPDVVAKLMEDWLEEKE